MKEIQSWIHSSHCFLTEVRDLGPAIKINKHILRLEVAVDNVLAMDVLQSLEDVDRNLRDGGCMYCDEEKQ